MIAQSRPLLAPALPPSESLKSDSIQFTKTNTQTVLRCQFFQLATFAPLVCHVCLCINIIQYHSNNTIQFYLIRWSGLVVDGIRGTTTHSPYLAFSLSPALPANQCMPLSHAKSLACFTFILCLYEPRRSGGSR